MSCNPFGLLWAGLVWPGLFWSLPLPPALTRSLLLLAPAASEMTEKLIKAKGAACDSVASESSEVLSDGLFDSYTTLHHPPPLYTEFTLYRCVCVLCFQSQHNKSQVNLNLPATPTDATLNSYAWQHHWNLCQKKLLLLPQLPTSSLSLSRWFCALLWAFRFSLKFD